MTGFTLFTLIFLVIGLAIYGVIVFWSGKRGFWWLAVLVTLPAAMGGLMYVLTPIEVPPDGPFFFRHFQWLVVGQFAFGALMYWAGRWKARRESSQKGVSS